MMKRVLCSGGAMMTRGGVRTILPSASRTHHQQQQQTRGGGCHLNPLLSPLHPQNSRTMCISIQDDNPMKNHEFYLQKVHQDNAGQRLTLPPRDPRYYKPTITEHGSYKDELAYFFSVYSRLTDELSHTFLLSKAKLMANKLPEQIVENVGRDRLENQEETIERYVKDSIFYDDYLTVKQLRKGKGKLKEKYFGKPKPTPGLMKYSRKILRNFGRLANTFSKQYPDLLERYQILDANISSHFRSSEAGAPIHIRGSGGLQMLSRKPLPLLAEGEVIENTINYQLPKLGPVSLLLDLFKSHTYYNKSNNGLKFPDLYPYPHTYFHTPTKRGNHMDSIFIPHTVMFAFSTALARAKQLHGEEEIDRLPEPIVTQCIGCNGRHLSYTIFQLNTTNFRTLDGVKNMVWIDGLQENTIFNSLDQTALTLDGLDTSVFHKFIAVYLNGVDR